MSRLSACILCHRFLSCSRAHYLFHLLSAFFCGAANIPTGVPTPISSCVTSQTNVQGKASGKQSGLLLTSLNKRKFALEVDKCKLLEYCLRNRVYVRISLCCIAVNKSLRLGEIFYFALYF